MTNQNQLPDIKLFLNSSFKIDFCDYYTNDIMKMKFLLN